MTTHTDLNLTPSGMRQSSSLTGMTSAGSLDPTAGIFRADPAPKNINEDAIDTLNHLLESCRDGEFGFRECAEHTQAPHIQTVFYQRSGDCQAAAAELYELVIELGGKPEEGGTASEALHRGWVAVKGTLSGYSDIDMLNECERAEDVALAQYRKALAHDLPPGAKAIVERQAHGAQLNHDQIKALRDSHRVSHAT